MTSRFLAWRKTPDGQNAEIKFFCEAYEKEQAEDRAFTEIFPITHRFFSDLDWRFAEQNGLTEGDLAAIKLYTGVNYDLFRSMSTPEAYTPEQRAAASLLERALKKLSPHEGIVYRFHHGDEALVAGKGVGDTVTNRRFLSSSKDIHWGGAKGDCNFFKIISRVGGRDVSAFNFFRGEEEVVILPGTNFRIKEKIPCENKNASLKGFIYVLEDVSVN